MQELARRLGLLDAALIVIGIVIGSGIFLLPNLIARSLPSATAIILIWVVTGILSFIGALAYAELGAMLPATGGQYVFLREAFGPMCAFLCGWVFVVTVIPGGIGFLAVGFSIYLDHFVALAPSMRTAVSVALIFVLSAINYVGIRPGIWAQRVLTFAKIGGLVFVIVVTAMAPHTRAVSTPAAGIAWSTGTAMTACLLAYNGWSYVSFVAGEVREPARNIPRALGLGMVLVMILYITANLGYLNVLTLPEIASAERVGALAMERAMGPIGATIVSAIVLISVAGAINACILTGPRIPFAQAADGLFFRRFATVHPRFKTPSFAIAVQAFWGAVVVISGSYETLATYSMLSAWLFYTLTVLAVLVLRRKMPNAPRPYRMWGYPASLWVFVAVSMWFMVDALMTQTVPSVIALAVVILGIPFYAIWRRQIA